MALSANSTSGPSSEINVTPLIDVLLVLLIIFMVIVPNAQRGLESSLPQGRASAALPPIVVRLLGADPAQPLQYRIGEHAVAYAELQPALRGLFAARQDRTLFVQADRNLSYQQVAAVVGEARKAGAGAVVLQPAAKLLSTKP